MKGFYFQAIRDVSGINKYINIYSNLFVFFLFFLFSNLNWISEIDADWNGKWGT